MNNKHRCEQSGNRKEKKKLVMCSWLKVPQDGKTVPISPRNIVPITPYSFPPFFILFLNVFSLKSPLTQTFKYSYHCTGTEFTYCNLHKYSAVQEMCCLEQRSLSTINRISALDHQEQLYIRISLEIKTCKKIFFSLSLFSQQVFYTANEHCIL